MKTLSEKKTQYQGKLKHKIMALVKEATKKVGLTKTTSSAEVGRLTKLVEKVVNAGLRIPSKDDAKDAIKAFKPTKKGRPSGYSLKFEQWLRMQAQSLSSVKNIFHLVARKIKKSEIGFPPKIKKLVIARCGIGEAIEMNQQAQAMTQIENRIRHVVFAEGGYDNKQLGESMLGRKGKAGGGRRRKSGGRRRKAAPAKPVPLICKTQCAGDKQGTAKCAQCQLKDCQARKHPSKCWMCKLSGQGDGLGYVCVRSVGEVSTVCKALIVSREKQPWAKDVLPASELGKKKSGCAPAANGRMKILKFPMFKQVVCTKKKNGEESCSVNKVSTCSKASSDGSCKPDDATVLLAKHY